MSYVMTKLFQVIFLVSLYHVTLLNDDRLVPYLGISTVGIVSKYFVH